MKKFSYFLNAYNIEYVIWYFFSCFSDDSYHLSIRLVAAWLWFLGHLYTVCNRKAIIYSLASCYLHFVKSRDQKCMEQLILNLSVAACIVRWFKTRMISVLHFVMYILVILELSYFQKPSPRYIKRSCFQKLSLPILPAYSTINLKVHWIEFSIQTLPTKLKTPKLVCLFKSVVFFLN